MPLHIVIGLDGPQRTAKPALVYLGETPSEAQKAMDGSTARRFVILRNPHGYGKNNPHQAANLAAVAARGSRPPAKNADGSMLITAKQLEDYQAELRRLDGIANEAQAKADEQGARAVELFDEVKRLQAELAAKSDPAVVPPNSPPTGESSPAPQASSEPAPSEAPPVAVEPAKPAKKK